MSTNRWRGDAPAVARVITLTVGGTVGTGDTAGYTINGKLVEVTSAGGDTTATFAAALQGALAGSAIPEFKEATWTYPGSGAVVTGTAQTPGVPFDGTASATGTATLTEAEVTASTGPNHADEPLNWSAGSLPAATENVLVDGGADLLYGWENVTAEAYSSLRIKASFLGSVGLPRMNSNGYVEYRTRQWTLDTNVPVTIGEGDGTGTVRVNLVSGSALSLVVRKTGARPDPAVPVVNVSGSSSGTLAAVAGDVGIGADDDTLSGTVGTATTNDGATLTVGKNATVRTLNRDGGAVVAYGTVTNLNALAGSTVLYVAPTAVTADGEGLVDCRFTETLGTATFRGQGGQDVPTLDCSNDQRGRTITNASFTGGAVFYDPDGTVTWSNPFTFDAASDKASVKGRRYNLLRS